MTTSKRTTRGAGSRADNGSASSTAPPQSAAPPITEPPGTSAPKVRVRQRKSTSASRSDPSGPHVAETNSSRGSTANSPHGPVDRYSSIAQAAYFRSQHRGFKPGHEMEDWLAAEAEVDQRLRVSGDSPG